jgi:hypothetical protein
MFRTLVRDSGTIYDVVGLESEGTTIDFQVGVNSYLYGTRFMSYLALRYGNDSLLAWVNRTEDSRANFATQFHHVYGRSLEAEWARWITWERDWQHANLAAIRRHPTTTFRTLTPRTLGSVSRAWYDSTTRGIYVGIRYPGQVAHLATIDVASGEIRNLTEVMGASGFSVTSLVFDPATRTLFYTTDNADWRNLAAYDLRTGTTTILQHDARIGDLAFNPVDRSLWGVRHDNGFSTVVRIPPPYREWNQVHTLPYGRDLFDLDISPDGKSLIASMSEVSGKQKLVLMDIAGLRAGDAAPDELYDFGDWSPSNFVYSADGRFLFGSSYYSGVSNIFRYDLTTRQMDALSNTETGFFKPVPVSRDSVVVFRYSGRGFVPSMIANQVPDSVSAIRFLGNEIAEHRPEVQEWMPPPDSSINADSITRSAHRYSSLAEFRLNSAYPVVEGYEDAAGNTGVAGGMRMNFSDRVGATALDLTASYSPGQGFSSYERLHARAVLHYWNWKVSAALNRADFYDLFGPTKLSRRGASVAVQYKNNIFTDGPRSLAYTLQVAGYTGLQTVPEYQGVSASFSKLASSYADLSYGSLRRSLGAIEDELGTTAEFEARGNYVNNAFYPRLNLDVSRGVLLPLDHSSLWLRASAGTALSGARTEPFANFFFGGFGNNWVDYRDSRQFRETQAFPGMDINAVGGRNYGRAQAEWVLPPLRFRHVGIPSFYFRWASLSFFGTGLMTDVDLASARRRLASAGAQLDVRTITLSHLESTFSLGFAQAAERGGRPHNAWMFSFKIM